MKAATVVATGIAAFHTTSRCLAAAPLHKLNYKRDIVYLYQFPRSPILPNLSPFCLKVETFLRIKGIKYEMIETLWKKSKNGLLPFVELNGEQISDSQIIFRRLEKHFDCEDKLSNEERAIARAVDRMLDGNTLHAIQLDRVIKHPHQFASRAVTGLRLPAFASNLLGDRMAKTIGGRMRKALGGLRDDEIRETLKRDLQAINDLIGNKRFLLGDTPTYIDCSIFGHVASTYFLPYRQALSDFLDDDFASLKGHIFRIRAHYYPEWKDN